MKILLLILYPLFILSRLLGILTGKDPLKHKRPADQSSYWQEHPPSPSNPEAYFSEDLPEAKPSLLVRVLIAISKLWNRKSYRAKRDNSPTSTASDEIPDEIYTMW
ncbi:MAG: hypothetical protein AAF591_11945 [Verrucomicrobiota bacterium]